jgi:hypothetical protein
MSRAEECSRKNSVDELHPVDVPQPAEELAVDDGPRRSTGLPVRDHPRHDAAGDALPAGHGRLHNEPRPLPREGRWHRELYAVEAPRRPLPPAAPSSWPPPSHGRETSHARGFLSVFPSREKRAIRAKVLMSHEVPPVIEMHPPLSLYICVSCVASESDVSQVVPR